MTSRILVRILSGLVGIGFGVGVAGGQPCAALGGFQPFSPSYISPLNGPGVTIQSGTLFIDTDRDGLVGASDTGDKFFPVPTELRTPNPGPLNMRVSPTHNFLFAAGGALNGCPTAGRKVRIYRVPAASGSDLELLFEDCVPCQGLDGGTLLWYDMGITQGGAGGAPPAANGTPISSRQMAFIRTNTNSAECGFGQPQLRFYDLVNQESAVYDQGLQPGSTAALVSPGGEYMVFQHDLTSVPTDSDVVVLNLCDITPLQTIGGNPPTLNDVSIPGINAHVVGSAGSTANLEIRNSSQAVVWTATAPCCSAGSDDLGSCCVNNVCSVTTQANCVGSGGVWTLGASCVNSPCTPTPANPVPGLNSPSPVTVGQTFTVPVTIVNQGQSPAINVVLSMYFSSQIFTFVSASNGGAPINFNPGSTRWTIPSVAGNSSTNLTVTLAARCFTGQQQLRLEQTATGIGLRTASQMVQINPVPATPLNVVLVSTPAGAEPLAPDTLVTHSIAMTNPGAVDTQVMSFTTNSGQSSIFESVDDCAGGSVCEIFNQGFGFRWSGIIPAGQTRTVRVTSRVRDCYSPTYPFVALGQEQSISVLDPCGVGAGQSNRPQKFRISRGVEARMVATNVTSGEIGTPGATNDAGVTVQPIEGEPALMLQATFVNKLAMVRDLGTVTIQFPSTWELTSPPTNGGVYDVQNKTWTLTGSMASLGTLSFEIGMQTADIQGSASLTMQRQTAECGNSVGSLLLLDVPPLPAGPVIVSTNNFFGGPLTILERGVDTAPREYLTGGGTWNGMSLTSTGDIWLFGDSLTRFNPFTLAFDTFPSVNAFAGSLAQASVLTDGAYQESTGDVIVYARSTATSGAVDSLIRFDPALGTMSVVAEVPATAVANRYGEVVIDSAGDILYCNHDQLLRYPGARGPTLPPNSGVLVTVPAPSYSDPNFGTVVRQRVWTFAPLCDGTYAVIHATEFANPVGLQFVNYARVFALSIFDESTGTVTMLDAFFAGEGSSDGNFYSPGSSLMPTFPISHPYPFEAGSITMLAGEPGEVLTANDSYPAFHHAAIDTTSGALTLIQDPNQFGFRSALDIVYLQPLSTDCSEVCIGDFNQDGGIDGSDVEAFFVAWEAGDASADVDADGGVTGSDVQLFFERWGAGC